MVRFNQANSLKFACQNISEPNRKHFSMIAAQVRRVLNEHIGEVEYDQNALDLQFSCWKQTL